MNTETIEGLIVDFSSDPFNEVLSFKVAEEYFVLNQIASAVSFYLRTVEYGTTPEYIYASLLKMAKCFESQNDRLYTVSNCILQAITVCPDRPEAYFYLSQFHERQSQWQECYTYACVGLSLVDNPVDDLPGQTEYKGPYCLTFEKAVAGWWVGRPDESRELLKEVLTQPNIAEEYIQAIQRNLATIGE